MSNLMDLPRAESPSSARSTILRQSASLTGLRGPREFDVIIWGATGYTGRLAVDYLAKKTAAKQQEKSVRHIRWAIAGRNVAKLQKLAREMEDKYKLDGRINGFLADLTNPQSLRNLAAKTVALCSFAGPFTVIGEPIIQACIVTQTHYIDATAESFWMKDMVDKYHEQAAEKDIKLIGSCGFDFVPNDVMMMQLQHALAKLAPYWSSEYPLWVNHLFRQSTPWVSGGTAQSGVHLVGKYPLSQAVEIYTNPYMFCEAENLKKATKDTIEKNTYFLIPDYVPQIKLYCTPFVMSSLMAKYVHWSNNIQGMPYGPNLIYHGGEIHKSIIMAYLMSVVIWMQYFTLLFVSKLPKLWSLLPAPGTGPAIHPKTAFMESILIARPYISPEQASRSTIEIKWRLDGGEAYVFAAISVIEGALAIALKDDGLSSQCGYLSPSAGIGQPLLTRLENSGIQMTTTEHIDEDPSCMKKNK